MTSDENVYADHHIQRRQNNEHDKHEAPQQKETLEQMESNDENKLFQIDRLPLLEGSPNQIAWANTIRLNFIKQTEKDLIDAKVYMKKISPNQEDSIDNINTALSTLLQTKTSSRYWIDHRIEKNYIMLKEFM